MVIGRGDEAGASPPGAWQRDGQDDECDHRGDNDRRDRTRVMGHRDQEGAETGDAATARHSQADALDGIVLLPRLPWHVIILTSEPVCTCIGASICRCICKVIMFPDR